MGGGAALGEVAQMWGGSTNKMLGAAPTPSAAPAEKWMVRATDAASREHPDLWKIARREPGKMISVSACDLRAAYFSRFVAFL